MKKTLRLIMTLVLVICLVFPMTSMPVSAATTVDKTVKLMLATKAKTTSVTLYEGQRLRITPRVTVKSGTSYVVKPMLPKYCTFTTKNGHVAYVSRSGIVTANHAGVVNIYVTNQTKTRKAILRVTVKAKPDTVKMTIKVGQTVPITLVNREVNQTISWYYSSDSVKAPAKPVKLECKFGNWVGNTIKLYVKDVARVPGHATINITMGGKVHVVDVYVVK